MSDEQPPAPRAPNPKLVRALAQATEKLDAAQSELSSRKRAPRPGAAQVAGYGASRVLGESDTLETTLAEGFEALLTAIKELAKMAESGVSDV